MGADQIGFLFKGPVRLDRSRENRARAIRRGNEVIAAIRAFRPDHPHPYVLDHLDPDDIAVLASGPDQLPDPAKLVRRLIRWWHEGARDTCMCREPRRPLAGDRLRRRDDLGRRAKRAGLRPHPRRLPPGCPAFLLHSRLTRPDARDALPLRSDAQPSKGRDRRLATV